MGDSELQRHLNSQAAEGQLDSDGHFTLSAAARLKGARFQLPPGAWTVKLIQALSCAGIGELTIKLKKSETIFEFQPPKCWSRDSVLSLFDVQVPQERTLRLLKFVLEFVVLSQGRSTLLRCFGTGSAAKWDGDSWQDVQSRPGFLGIEVSHLSDTEKETLSSRERGRLARTRYMVVGSAINEHKLLTPFDIKYDGMLLSSDLAFMDHLMERGSCLLHLMALRGWLKYRLEAVTRKSLGREADSEGKEPSHPDLLFLSIETSKSAFEEYIKSGSPDSLEEGTSPSICYWVADGVLVGQDRFEVRHSSVTLSVYAEASRLPFDIGTLGLIQGRERAEKLEEIQKAISGQIPNLEFWAKRSTYEEREKFRHKSGIASLGALVGLGLSISTGLAPLFACTGLLSLGGYVGFFKPSGSEVRLLELENLYKLLQDNFNAEPP